MHEGAKVDLLVLGRLGLMRLVAPCPFALISITDPGKPDALLPEGAACRDVLRLRFHDIGPRWERTPIDTSDLVRMAPEQARAAADFARRWVGEVPLIVVQCEAGISRSAAVAAAISKAFNGDDAIFHQEYVPNSLVYELVLAALIGTAEA